MKGFVASRKKSSCKTRNCYQEPAFPPTVLTYQASCMRPFDWNSRLELRYGNFTRQQSKRISLSSRRLTRGATRGLSRSDSWKSTGETSRFRPPKSRQRESCTYICTYVTAEAKPNILLNRFLPPTYLNGSEGENKGWRTAVRLPKLTPQTLSQFWSFKIRRTTFLNLPKFADLLIARF